MKTRGQSTWVRNIYWWILPAVVSMPPVARAQDYSNIIAFVNQSGDDTLVKLVGPVRSNVAASNASSKWHSCAC